MRRARTSLFGAVESSIGIIHARFPPVELPMTAAAPYCSVTVGFLSFSFLVLSPTLDWVSGETRARIPRTALD